MDLEGRARIRTGVIRKVRQYEISEPNVMTATLHNHCEAGADYLYTLNLRKTPDEIFFESCV